MANSNPVPVALQPDAISPPSRPNPASPHGNTQSEPPTEPLQSSASTVVALDIEHVAVADDPRQWSRNRKLTTLGVIAFTSIATALSVNLYNPAIKQIEQDLHASSSQISLSLSLFILVQGNAPLFWSAVSEIKGRKGPYMISMAIFAVGSIVSASAKKISVLIAMRVFQALGSSSALTLGGGTLADMYESYERGTIMGIYYAAPLMGPSLGPILGGLLTSAFSWRATFWILVILAGLALLLYLFVFRDTFRKERSLAYQRAIARARQENARKGLKQASQALEGGSRKQQKASAGAAETDAVELKEVAVSATRRASLDGAERPIGSPKIDDGIEEIRLTLADVNVLGSAWKVIKKPSNATTLIGSGLYFAFQYGICYTVAITFAEAPYNYGPIVIGLILLSFGLGCVGGSIFGGRWIDRALHRQQVALERQRDPEGRAKLSTPEMRLRSTLIAMPFLPLSVIAYAWMAHFKVHIAGPLVALFIAGFSVTWIYTSTLAYIVDANKGQSTTAIATNSSARGTMGFVIAEISVPLQNALGDGGLYTLWAGILICIELLTILVMYRGAAWREAGEAREAARAKTIEPQGGKTENENE
ncbi:vacuolar DHA amino acid exporter [Clavulina sp. PMI_390]|nr:vacuolar DHA amino acid exporter [Clavulina sp. PMI_390]